MRYRFQELLTEVCFNAIHVHLPSRFVKFAALLSGATGISGFVPSSIQRVFAIEPTPGTSFVDAEHIVILMQENRSFDHALGSLKGVHRAD
ncbi:alkaline phosphatase family protein [Acidicapsa acidisoli]|uniref:alkaline phosphatase family protein n=1 Tax=Acidicapsa acidisoli TaxID=1615681 RepID=UPI0021E06494|nr:alkaline phosphatase family protein [Acidicapsa acidisoli]